LSFRFQADADLNPEIGRGLRRREPSIDFRAAVGVIAEGTPDSEVLQIAADDGRVLFHETLQRCQTILLDSLRSTNLQGCF
jgi:hypothetical protein